MPRYLLIESRDPFESKGFSQRCELALTLQSEDTEVSVFLVENAVLGARAAAKLAGLDKLAKAGVRLFADEFALRERGVTELAPNISGAGLETLIDELAAGAKALWS